MDLKGAELRNIKEICSLIGKKKEVPLKVNIPFYQRPFRWEEEHVEKLIDDFYENCIEQGDNYFAGAMVTIKNDNKNSDDDFDDIVDGHQRITIMYLIMYYKFLLLCIYNDLKISTRYIDTEQMLELISLINSIFINKNKNTIVEDLKNIKNKASYISYDNVNDWEEILKKFRANIGLIYFNNENYEQKYNIDYSIFFKNFKLTLKYSRISFNQDLESALSSVYMVIKDPLDFISLNSIEDLSKIKKKSEVVYKYLYTLNLIHNKLLEYVNNRCTFQNISEDNNQIQIAKISYLIQTINFILTSIQFCVIQSGNEEDANVLFEVLNNRSLPLNDLDLIKNLFYKRYYEKNSNNLQLIDKCIGELETLWGNEIFPENLCNYERKKIKIFGTIFITGDKNLIQAANKPNFMEAIKKYLNDSYPMSDDNISYNCNDIKLEFNIYKYSNQILNFFNITQNKKNSELFVVEAAINSSFTYRTMLLLNALGYDGVMASLNSLIIYHWLNESKNNQNFSFERFMKNIMDFKYETNNYLELSNFAKNVWKLSLLSNDCKIPLEYVQEVIKSNSLTKNKTCIPPDYNTNINFDTLFRKAQKQFEEKILNLKQKTNDAKLKVLFLNLYKYYDANNKIILKSPINTFAIIREVAEKLQFDHFEPQEIGSKNKFYFTPKNHMTRDFYINMIGNFVLIPSKDNKIKSNMPSQEAREIYRKALLPEWFINDLYEDFDKYKINGKLTENFFIERTNKLKNYFIELVETI